MIQLIVDSGSTKADWRTVQQDMVTSFSTQGLNPYFLKVDELESIIRLQVLPYVAGQMVGSIYFYGAGCAHENRKLQISSVLSRFFPGSTINVATDLLGAARGLLKHEAGFAVIVGTGTNSGRYDGRQIVHSIDSLGYFLGDEGSGAAIGRKLLRDYLRGYLPEELNREFALICPYNREQVLDHLYTKPFPNRFLASFTPFAAIHLSSSYIQELIKESFRDLFTHLISHYEDFQQSRLCCTGSVAFVFKEYLLEVAGEFKARIEAVSQSPIEELVVYHQSI